MRTRVGVVVCMVAWAATGTAQRNGQAPEQTIDLPTSKQLIGEIPGKPERLNSLPMTMAVSPDGRYVVTVNAGYGTAESNYEQSLAVLDTQTGKIEDFPDARTVVGAKQTLYAGLAFSRDGKHLYASMGSTTDPVGDGTKTTGNAIVVYGFAGGKIAPERLIPLPLEQLAAGRKTKLVGDRDGDKGVPFPAAIAVIGAAGQEKLLVAENLSDDVVLVDAASGKIEKRFDLAENETVPSTYPIDLAVTADGTRAFVALWNASEMVELDLVKGTVGRKVALLKPRSAIAAGSHPCALEVQAGWEDAVCGAGESGCCGGGGCCDAGGEGVLRYAAAAPDLLWRGAGGAGGEWGRVAPLCGERDQRFDCGV
jgi:DNA-binding beta-propeller fold protein YncE